MGPTLAKRFDQQLRQLRLLIGPVPTVGDIASWSAWMLGERSLQGGTCDLQNQNEIHLVEFSEDTAEIACKQTIPTDDEVWILSPSPTDSQVAHWTQRWGNHGKPGSSENLEVYCYGS
eukprot:Skav230236  [mRNA]  locus=scaffold4204:161213:165031:- [translate_table: standard]